jgi:AcrR family transcriptional regulator
MAPAATKAGKGGARNRTKIHSPQHLEKLHGPQHPDKTRDHGDDSPAPQANNGGAAAHVAQLQADATAPAEPRSPHSRRKRGRGPSERREAILAAALEEFSTSGFAATRLDDVAQRAGVAKGTIYLYFQDKESLFQELVRTMLGPVVGFLEAAPLAELPVRVIAERIADMFVREIYSTRRKDVLRLIITEGARFPQLAEFYYREVTARILPAMRALLTRATERGELTNDALARFPQLLVAPGLVAVVWNALFDRFDPLDVRALMSAHLDVLFGERTVR